MSVACEDLSRFVLLSRCSPFSIPFLLFGLSTVALKDELQYVGGGNP
jgi:hypothetical protein